MIDIQISFADVAQFVGTVVIILAVIWFVATYKLTRRGGKDDPD